MHLPDSDDRVNALIRAEHADDPSGLNAAHGICWPMLILLVAIVVGMLFMFGNK